ncbi:hypothetical protein KKB55_12210, partial [Myxococcota bacterium]|nr:hypothetical protein [Myxococcota bacterium]
MPISRKPGEEKPSASAAWGAHLQRKAGEEGPSVAPPRRRAPPRPSPSEENSRAPLRPTPARGLPRQDSLESGMIGQARRKLDRRASHPKRAIPVNRAAASAPAPLTEAAPATPTAAIPAPADAPPLKLKRPRVAQAVDHGPPLKASGVILALYALIAFAPLLWSEADTTATLRRAYEITLEEAQRLNEEPKLGLWLESKNLTQLQGVQRQGKAALEARFKAAGLEIGADQIRFRLREGALLISVDLSDEARFSVDTDGAFVGRGPPP